MKTDKKYMMIVTEEDDRYDTEDGYDCDEDALKEIYDKLK